MIEQMNRELLNYRKYNGYTIKAYDFTDRHGFDNIGLKDEDWLHLVFVAYSGRGELHRGEFMVEIRWIDETGKDRDLDPELVEKLLRPDDEKMKMVDDYVADTIFNKMDVRKGRVYFHECKWSGGRSMLYSTSTSYAKEFTTYYGNLLQAALKHRDVAKTAQDQARVAYLISKVDKFNQNMAHPAWANSTVELANRGISSLKSQIQDLETKHGQRVKEYRDSIAVLEKYDIPYEQVEGGASEART